MALLKTSTLLQLPVLCCLLMSNAWASHMLAWSKEIPGESLVSVDDKLQRIFLGVRASSSVMTLDSQGRLLWQSYSDTAFAISRDGSRVWVSSGTRGLILDGATGNAVIESEELRGVHGLCGGEDCPSGDYVLSPDGRTLYSAVYRYSDETNMYLESALTVAVDAASGKTLWRNRHDSLLSAYVGMSADGSIVVNRHGIFDRAGRILWVASGQTYGWNETVKRHPNRLWPPDGKASFDAVSRDGRYLIIRGNTLAIRQGDPERPWKEVRLPVGYEYYDSFEVSSDGKHIFWEGAKPAVDVPPATIALLTTDGRMVWSKVVDFYAVGRRIGESYGHGCAHGSKLRFLDGDKVWVSFTAFDDVLDFNGKLIKRIVLPIKRTTGECASFAFRQLDRDRYAYVVKRVQDDAGVKATLELWLGNLNEPD